MKSTILAGDKHQPHTLKEDLTWHGLSVALVVASVAWTIEASINSFLFSGGHLLTQLFPTDLTELWDRGALAFLTILFGAYVQATTRQNAYEKRALDVEAHFGEVLQTSSNAILMIDEDLQIVLFNQGAAKMFGYQAAEVLGKPLTLLIPEDLEPDSKSKSKKTTAGLQKIQGLLGGANTGIRCRKKDGKVLSAEASISKLEREGSVIYTAIIRDITERLEAEKTIRSLAFYDQVTGLANRSYFRALLRQSLKKGLSTNTPIALLLIDLDRFKDVNDTLGHHRGDLLLREVGFRLKALVEEDKVVARLGGDEFALFLDHTDEAAARIVGQKILSELSKPFKLEGLPIPLETSLGIALFPEHGADPGTLLQRADVAMYEAKREGSGMLVYAPEKDEHTPKRLARMGALRDAITNNELCLYFQPKVRMASRAIFDVEALVRWDHPEEGVLTPDQFILPAERTGLINTLTEWVLREAIRQCSVWHKQGIAIGVAVNLSARNLHDTTLPDLVVEILNSYSLPAVFLELEVTESAIMSDTLKAQGILRKLRDLGVRIAIDDFGVGYSSFEYLKNLDADVIKIDKSFTQHMTQDQNASAIVHSMIELGHNLGLMVVSEGVENKETWDKLAKLDCDVAQGYYMTVPLSGEDCTHWIRNIAPQKGWHLQKPIKATNPQLHEI